jgi:uncharacterized membrane protein YeiH
MFYALEFAAVLSAAIYGVLRGLRKDFDIVGLISVSFAVAFGGGTLRDVLLDRRPLFWVENEAYLWTVLVVAVIGAVLPRQVAKLEPWLALPDALGLGLWSVAGTVVAVEAGMSPLVSAVFGVMTGSFGGVIGDIICNETPSLFRKSPLYATCALAGSVTYLALDAAGVSEWTSQPAGVAVAFALRMVAVQFNLHVPVKTLQDK